MDYPQQKHSKILVIGETCLDRYVFGTCERISPEAPVPILNTSSDPLVKKGMAANVATNIMSLGQEADLVEPLIVKDTSTVAEVCNSLHRDFVRKFRFARVKGPSAKFDWQRVGLDHLLKDGDLLTIITRKS